MFIEQGLIIDKDHQELEKAISECLFEVAKFTGIPLVAEEATERQQCEFLTDLYIKFKPRNAAKGLDPPFLLKEVCSCFISELY